MLGVGEPFKSYQSIIAQIGVAVPTQTLLDNSLSETASNKATLGRTGVGVYTIVFPTAVLFGNVFFNLNIGTAVAFTVKATKTNLTTITISTFTAGGVAVDLEGDLHFKAEIWS